MEAVCAGKVPLGGVARFLFALMHLLLGYCPQKGNYNHVLIINSKTKA